MKKWEYSLEDYDFSEATEPLDSMRKTLNSLDEDGWELIQIVPGPGKFTTFVLRRERKITEPPRQSRRPTADELRVEGYEPGNLS